MKGLLLKEFYYIYSHWKYILFIATIFALAFGPAGDGRLAAMFTFVGTIMLVNGLAQDEMDQWNRQAFTMPVTCRQLVLAKYIFALLLCLLGAAAGLVLTLLTWILGIAEPVTAGGLLLECILCTGIVLLISALMIPLNLKFGMQKSRIVLLGFVAVPVILGLVGSELELQIPSVMFYGNWWILGGAAVLLVAVLLAASFMASVRILKKKEF